MAPSFGSAWRSFWHTMTSSDRHASHDSPYRTGQHMPLNQNRHAPLTSVATTASDSRVDLTSPYPDDNANRSSAALQNGWPASPGALQSPTTPYSPGMRSAMHRIQSKDNSSNNNTPLDGITPGEIQMQNFQEGLPPPPPVSHSWKRIDKWAEAKYEELYDQLSEGCTQNDVNELEHELDCSLPMEVRDSLQIHDGQERGGRPTGIIFGCMLLDCEEIVQEWKNWRVVNEEYLTLPVYQQPQAPAKAFGGSSSAPHSLSQPATNPLWRQELLDRQDSQPPRAIQRAYTHAGWIPLARDWGGNNIAVDLAPGPAGKWGQIIIFGRDYDCKYVVARSWSAFLATVADDICSEKVFVDEETQELKLKEFKASGVEPAYLDILRWRMDQKYGRKGPRRPPANDPSAGSSNGF
ncbi:MAG: 1,3-beta-glucan biosynthesis [Lasallia pustulata]|uniref:1,3-beta-glucan biosynthesis n=1 Tax=Lasallia pustulata TaxID=136370 RepID=A0A5M8PEG1_9LECA|nr:MAG: 1,3-beta-glucan biosynthesis [Lasallia pustulata]